MVHKKHKKKFLNILLIPDNESNPRSYRIRYIYIRILVLVGIVFLISLILGIITYGRVLQSAIEKDAILRENVQLKQQLQKLTQIEEELQKLRSYNQKVRQSLGGYIKFAEEPEAVEAMDETFAGLDLRKNSILTTIPLKSPVTGFISQQYNWPVHNGIDIVAPAGTPIRAAGDGQVLFSGWTYPDGYVVILAHNSEYVTYYKHNLRNLVFTHQWVKQGDVIALLGNSGEKSSGPHLHFEIWYQSRPINPMRFLIDVN